MLSTWCCRRVRSHPSWIWLRRPVMEIIHWWMTERWNCSVSFFSPVKRRNFPSSPDFCGGKWERWGVPFLCLSIHEVFSNEDRFLSAFLIQEKWEKNWEQRKDRLLKDGQTVSSTDAFPRRWGNTHPLVMIWECIMKLYFSSQPFSPDLVFSFFPTGSAQCKWPRQQLPHYCYSSPWDIWS